MRFSSSTTSILISLRAPQGQGSRESIGCGALHLIKALHGRRGSGGLGLGTREIGREPLHIRCFSTERSRQADAAMRLGLVRGGNRMNLVASYKRRRAHEKVDWNR